MVVQIENKGQKLESKNYWESELAIKGMLYVSVHNDYVRLLLPKAQEGQIDKMKNGEVVIISKGIYKNRKAVEIMFEDNSNNPYCIHISSEQFDMLPKDGDKWKFAIHTENEKVFTQECKVRSVNSLPYMEPWKRKPVKNGIG